MNFLVNHQTAPPSNSSFPKLVIKFWTQSYCSHTILCAIYPLDVCVYSSSCVSLGKMFQIKKINNPAPNQQTHGNNVDSQNPTEVRSMVKSNHQKKMVQLEAFSVVCRTKKTTFFVTEFSRFSFAFFWAIFGLNLNQLSYPGRVEKSET